MSLEEALAANTAALEANTAMHEKVLAALGATGKAAAKTTSTKAAADKKPAAASKKAAAAKKGPTEKDLHALYSGFLSGADDKADKKVLAGAVKKVLEHFGAERITEIEEDNRASAMEYGKLLVSTFEDGGVDAVGELTFDFEEADGDDDGDDGDDVL